MILNLAYPEKSEIPVKIFHFPDGEVQVELGQFSRKEEVIVWCRVTNAEELFILLQTMDILDRNGMPYDVHITYLMGMRMDRVMDFNRPFTLKIVYDAIDNHTGSHFFKVLELHSQRLWAFDKFLRWGNLYPDTNIRPDEEYYQIVYPDAGAAERYGAFEDDVTCSKVRDSETGKILELKVDNPELIEKDRDLLIKDDLCDGGGTFCGLAEAFNKLGIPKERLNISVIHMVNRKGIENLSKCFNHVFITNSYKDWDNLPDNVTMYDVFTNDYEIQK